MVCRAEWCAVGARGVLGRLGPGGVGPCRAVPGALRAG